MTKEATTEVIMIPLLPGLDLDTGDAKEIWDSTLSTIADQPGYQKMFYGRQVEHPDTLQVCISKSALSPSTPPPRSISRRAPQIPHQPKNCPKI
jgi:hypothetical protein